MNIAVTLVEGEFLYGAGALLNSLCRNGFHGTFVVGYREEASLPQKLYFAMKNGMFEAGRVKVVFQQGQTDWHFTNHKPAFMRRCLTEFSGAKRIVYLDPDIVMTCPWEFVERWVDSGVALCADVNYHMDPNHPIRCEWRRIIAEAGWEVRHEPHQYFNGGLLGLCAANFGVAERWHRLIEGWGSESNPLAGSGSIESWRKGGRWLRLMSPNQDTLNIAAMAWHGPLSTIGPDAMGFVPGNTFFPHAIGSLKPWSKRFLWEALSGRPPTLADKMFLEFADGPLALYPKWRLNRIKLALGIGSALGRIYRRA